MKLGIKLTGNLAKEINALVKTGEDKIVDAAIEALKEATPVDTGYARDHWKRNAEGQIVNESEYMSELNAGSSQQAAPYFIERTLLSQEGIVPSGTIVRQQ